MGNKAKGRGGRRQGGWWQGSLRFLTLGNKWRYCGVVRRRQMRNGNRGWLHSCIVGELVQELGLNPAAGSLRANVMTRSAEIEIKIIAHIDHWLIVRGGWSLLLDEETESKEESVAKRKCGDGV